MSLADLLAEGPPRTRKGPQCSMQTVLVLLPDDERQALDVMLSNPAWTGPVLSDALHKQYGARIKPEVINRHRRGDCSCGDTDVR